MAEKPTGKSSDTPTADTTNDRKGFDGVALCNEAQADGVPCTEMGRKCETCEHAVRAIGADALREYR